MDILQDITTLALSFYTNSTTTTTTSQTPTPPNLLPYLTPLLSILTPLKPLLTPLLHTIQTSPILLSFLLLLTLLFITYQIISAIRRLIFWGLGILVKLAVIGVVVAVAVRVGQRGVGEVGREVVEWGRGVGGVWWEEYRRWEGVGRGGGGGSGGRRGGESGYGW